MKGGADFLVNVNKTGPQRGCYSLETITPWVFDSTDRHSSNCKLKRPHHHRGTAKAALSLNILEVHKRESDKY